MKLDIALACAAGHIYLEVDDGVAAFLAADAMLSDPDEPGADSVRESVERRSGGTDL